MHAAATTSLGLAELKCADAPNAHSRSGSRGAVCPQHWFSGIHIHTRTHQRSHIAMQLARGPALTTAQAGELLVRERFARVGRCCQRAAAYSWHNAAVHPLFKRYQLCGLTGSLSAGHGGWCSTTNGLQGGAQTPPIGKQGGLQQLRRSIVASSHVSSPRHVPMQIIIISSQLTSRQG